MNLTAAVALALLANDGAVDRPADAANETYSIEFPGLKIPVERPPGFDPPSPPARAMTSPPPAQQTTPKPLPTLPLPGPAQQQFPQPVPQPPPTTPQLPEVSVGGFTVQPFGSLNAQTVANGVNELLRGPAQASVAPLNDAARKASGATETYRAYTDNRKHETAEYEARSAADQERWDSARRQVSRIRSAPLPLSNLEVLAKQTLIAGKARLAKDREFPLTDGWLPKPNPNIAVNESAIPNPHLKDQTVLTFAGGSEGARQSMLIDTATRALDRDLDLTDGADPDRPGQHRSGEAIDLRTDGTVAGTFADAQRIADYIESQPDLRGRMRVLAEVRLDKDGVNAIGYFENGRLTKLRIGALWDKDKPDPTWSRSDLHALATHVHVEWVKQVPSGGS